MTRWFGLGSGILSLPAGTGSFSIATTPSTSTATKVPYSPNLVAGPTGLDPYRPWSTTVIDGEFFLTNGWDSPRRWDRTLGAFAYMGSVAPTTFALALSSAGSPAAIPTGQTARYYLVGLNSTLDKESAPQGGGELTIANSSGATRDVTITWTASEFAVDQDKVRIYRALYQTDDFKKVADVAVATATYLDVTPDASLISNASWNGAQRTTLPPAFAGILESQGLLLGWERSGNVLRYSQGVRVSGTFVADDFPEENILQVGSDESTGPLTAVISYHRSNILWKRRAIYEMAGSDISTWDIRTLTTARGTFNPRTVVGVDRWFICLDELGMYKLTPGLYAGNLGSVEDQYHAPMQPIYDRMNLSASDLFWAQHIPESGQVIFWVALDYDPIPNTGIIFNYGTGKFGGIVTRRNPTVGAYLNDSQGVRHPCFGDDMGYLWEDLYAQSEGCFSGDNTAVVTSGVDSTRVVTASAAAFSSTLQGAPGTPLDRYSSAGTLIDENRVYSNTGTAITTYLYPTTTVAAGNSVAVGVIPGVFETGQFAFSTHEMKNVRDVYVEFASGVSGSVRIDTALDDDDFIRKWEQSLASDVRAIIPMGNVNGTNSDRCWVWKLRVSQRYANLGFSVRALHIHYDLMLGKRS